MDTPDPNIPGYASMPAFQPLNQPAPSPHKPLTPFTIVKRIGITIFAIICILGIWETLFPTKPPTNNTNPAPSTTSNKPFTWKDYTNTKLHYALKYPDTLELSQESPYSTVFQIKNHQQLVFPSLYVSVIPDGYTQSTNKIYNFMPTTIINNFFTMQDNTTQNMQPDQDPQYWTYTKLATISLAGQQAIVIQNNNVWQAQNGEINRRVLLKANGFTYIIGTYFTNQQGLTDYHDFLYSFKIIKGT